MNRKINIKWFMGSDQSRHTYVATVAHSLRRWYRRRCTASGNKTDISRRSKITVTATAAVLLSLSHGKCLQQRGPTRGVFNLSLINGLPGTNAASKCRDMFDTDYELN